MVRIQHNKQLIYAIALYNLLIYLTNQIAQAKIN